MSAKIQVAAAPAGSRAATEGLEVASVKNTTAATAAAPLSITLPLSGGAISAVARRLPTPSGLSTMSIKESLEAHATGGRALAFLRDVAITDPSTTSFRVVINRPGLKPDLSDSAPGYVGTFVDEAMIRNLIARYADVATRADYESFHSLWTEDGEFIIGEAPKGHHATGPTDTVALFRKLRAGKRFFVQFALPGVIDLNGDEATTRTFIHESAQGSNDTYYRCHCIAFDQLKRSGGDWLFKSRSFQYLWLDTGPFSGNGFPLFPTRSDI